MARGKIDWDEVFKKYVENGVLKKTYSAIAREFGVSVEAVRKQLLKRGARLKKADRLKVEKRPSTSTFQLPPESKGGGRPGNTNALKHGLYARVFLTEQGKEIYKQRVESDEIPDPIGEIKFLQAKIASGEVWKVKDVLTALEIMSRLYDKVIGMARNEIEKRKLEFEKERVEIMREKLELEKAKLGEEAEAEITIELLGDEDNEEDNDTAG